MSYLDEGYNFLLGVDKELDNSDGINTRNVDQIFESGAVTFDYTSMASLSPNQDMQSEDFITGVQGWKIYGDGNAEFASLTLTVGTVKYGKTSFIDSVHSGYYIGSEGVYFGSSGDATKLKFDIATGIFDIVGGTIKTDTSPNRVEMDSTNYISVFKTNIRRVKINEDSMNFYDSAGTPVATIYGDSGILELLTPFGNSLALTTTHNDTDCDPIIFRSRTGGAVYTDMAYFDYDPVAGENSLVMQGTNNKIESENFVVTSRVNPQSGTSYTLKMSDICKLVTFSNSSPITVTLPTYAVTPIPIGSQIDIAQIGTGKVTVAGAGTIINSKGGNKSVAAQYVGISLFKTGADTWLLLGDLIA